MAYFECDECNKKHYIFGIPRGKEVAEKYGIASHAALPLDSRIAYLLDRGLIYEYDAADALKPILEIL